MTDPTVLAVLAALSLPTGTAWVDQKEVTCLTRAVYQEAGGRHVQTKIATAYAILDRAALEGLEVCKLVANRKVFPWRPRQSKLRADTFAEHVAWDESAQAAVLSYVGEVERPCAGNPTHFDRFPGRWDKWKEPSYSIITCVLDGVGFWRKKP
jgi:hypothetical protein